MANEINRKVAHVLKIETQLKNGIQELLGMISAGEQINKIATPVENKTWGPGVPIPEEIRDKAKALLREKVKASEVSRALKISLPMVHKIKSEIGLVKHRSFLRAVRED